MEIGAGADELAAAAGVEEVMVGVVPATAAAAAAAYRMAGRGAAAGGRAAAAATVGLEGRPALRAEDIGCAAKFGDGTGGGFGASGLDSSVALRTGVFFVDGLVVSSVDGFLARAPLLLDDSSS